MDLLEKYLAENTPQNASEYGVTRCYMTPEEGHGSRIWSWKKRGKECPEGF